MSVSYRNNFAYIYGSNASTLNPANYPNAPSGIQLNAYSSVAPGTTTSFANGSAFYAKSPTLNLRIYNYGTATGAPGTGSNSSTTKASPGGDGVYLNGPGLTFFNGSHNTSGYPGLSAKLYGGEGGFDSASSFLGSAAGGPGADVRNGATLDNLANGHIYAGAPGAMQALAGSGFGVSLDGVPSPMPARSRASPLRTRRILTGFSDRLQPFISPAMAMAARHPIISTTRPAERSPRALRVPEYKSPLLRV